MKKAFTQLIPILFATLAASCALADAPQQPAQSGATQAQFGRWLTGSGNLEVEIAPCGNAICGTVVRVLANRSMSGPGAEMTPAGAASPLGMKILQDFVATGGGEWKGRIYNRENGETYDCLMSLAAPDQLKIRAYKGLPLFGKTQVWQRISAGTAQ